jgi:putative membrane protein
MKKVLGIAILAGSLGAVPAFAQSTPDQTKPQPKPKSTTSSKTPGQKSGQSQGQTEKTAGTSGTLAPADHNFVNEAAIGGLAEVELGNLAKEKASNPDVKSFGDRMATDHGKANDELKSWAQQKNVTLPTELDAKHKALRDRLSKLSGEAFDKAYMHEMVMDHTHDVAAFKRESTAAKDPDLKAWAGKTLPTLQDHMKMAKDTSAKVGSAGTSGTTPAKKSATPKKSSGK